jgi:acetyl-CoA acetyltransferase
MSLSNIASNLFSKGGKAHVLSQNDNDVVIVVAVRSAITKGMKGGFKDTRPEEYLSGILGAVWRKAGIDPALIEDIAVGNVLPPGGGALTARMAALAAGIPESVPISTVNRQCSSGLQAVNTIAAQIASGQIDIGIGEFVAYSHPFPGKLSVTIRRRCRVDDSRFLQPRFPARGYLGEGPCHPQGPGVSSSHGNHL